MATDDHTRRWRRSERAPTASDAIQMLRRAIKDLRDAPHDPEARRRVRAIAAEHDLWETLALLLADEARAHAEEPAVAAVFYEELADVHHALDQPIETIAAMEALVAITPDDFAHHERLAAFYRQAGAWAKAADAFEQVALRAPEQVARAALLDAARLHRDNHSYEIAAKLFRRLVERRPTDLLAWRALDDMLCELGRWREVAEVRGERAARAESGFEKAALLRAQARALEQAGDQPAAASVVARASTHAPAEVSVQIDEADVLARGGRGPEAAAILRARIAEAVKRGVAADDLAALRLRLAQVLEDGCDDRPGAAAVVDELLAAMPKHLAALEWITALAATDPDPAVHAAALLRYAAALPESADRAAYVVAAGRRMREAGDLRRATSIFEEAAALAGDDEQLQRELHEVRSSSIVEASLAQADELVSAGRGGEAAELLRERLAAMPESAPAVPMARLVHRCAQLVAASGDADESHQLLYEAHRLDRSSLAITIALGDSCFARKLWRQAALHLGAAAAHPDAARQAPLVAAALVRAAQAEIRALRGAGAVKHYEAAVRIDPTCATAWHGLAEIAIERGDLARGAECLEREASATGDPKDRLRLFDALGDMALDVLADPARAEQCWRQVADAGHGPVLDKLLAVQRRRGATVERAETCERLARLQPDAAARKALLIEAAEALRAGGAHERAVAVAEELIALDPRDLDSIVSATSIALAAGDAKRAATWARRLVGAGDAEDVRAGLELVCAIGAPLLPEDERFLDANPPRPMPSDAAYAAALDDDDRRELIDDPAERPLRDVLALLAEVLPLVLPAATAALAEAGLADAARVPASSDAAAAAIYPQIARALGGPPTLLYTSPRAAADPASPAVDVTLLPAAPPVVVLGPRLASMRAGSQGEGHVASDAALRFQLARIVELSRPYRIFAALPADGFAALVAGLGGDALRAKLPIALRQRLTERLATLAPADLDPATYTAACQRAADRAGLLACGDIAVAIEAAGGVRRAPHLVRLAASRRYLAARKKLRAR